MYKRQFFWLIGGFRLSKVSGSVQLEAWPQGSVTHPYQRRKNIYDLEKGVKKLLTSVLLNNPSPQVYVFCVGRHFGLGAKQDGWQQQSAKVQKGSPLFGNRRVISFFFFLTFWMFLFPTWPKFIYILIWKVPYGVKTNSPMFSENNIYV